MQNPAYEFAIQTFKPMLSTLANLLDKGAAHAAATGLDPAALVEGRLAPDMFTLAQQVEQACAYAIGAVRSLTGAEPPAFEGADASFADLKARIAHALAFVESAPAAAFAGAEDRTVTLPLRGGLVLEAKGYQVLRDWSLPHFYFHVVTAYDILRHAGAPIGKLDYLAHVGYAIRQAGAAPAA